MKISQVDIPENSFDLTPVSQDALLSEYWLSCRSLFTMHSAEMWRLLWGTGQQNSSEVGTKYAWFHKRGFWVWRAWVAQILLPLHTSSYKHRQIWYLVLQTSKCHWFCSWAVGDDIADLFNLWKPRGFQHGLRLGLSSCSRRQPICIAMRCHYFCSVSLKFQCWTCSVANCTKWDPPKSCGPAKWIWGASFIATKGLLRVTVK